MVGHELAVSDRVRLRMPARTAPAVDRDVCLDRPWIARRQVTPTTSPSLPDGQPVRLPDGDRLDEGDHERDLLITPAEAEADEHRDRCTEQPGGQDRLLTYPQGDRVSRARG